VLEREAERFQLNTEIYYSVQAYYKFYNYNYCCNYYYCSCCWYYKTTVCRGVTYTSVDDVGRFQWSAARVRSCWSVRRSCDAATTKRRSAATRPDASGRCSAASPSGSRSVQTTIIITGTVRCRRVARQLQRLGAAASAEVVRWRRLRRLGWLIIRRHQTPPPSRSVCQNNRTLTMTW